MVLEGMIDNELISGKAYATDNIYSFGSLSTSLLTHPYILGSLHERARITNTPGKGKSTICLACGPVIFTTLILTICSKIVLYTTRGPYVKIIV